VTQTPTVSALVAAYNYEQYVGAAIESALAQDYPPDCLEVIVVDDGSTDATADVVAELIGRHPGRVRLFRQENAGYIPATNHAMAEARGELFAILDADDLWREQKIRRNVELLCSRPALGLVFSDMAVIDSDGRVVEESFVKNRLGEVPRRALGRLLVENFVTASSIVVRADLRSAFDPIPDEIPYADWWLALNVARVAELDWIREPLALYRLHTANLTHGASGVAAVREHRKHLDLQLWALRNLDLGTLAAEELLAAWQAVERNAFGLIEVAGSPFVEPAELTGERRAAVEPLLAAADAAGAAGDAHEDARLVLKALASDPSRLDVLTRFKEAVARARELDALPDPLEGRREFVILSDVEDLLADDELLRDYCTAFTGCDSATLAIDATRLAPDIATVELRKLAERCDLTAHEDVHLLAVVGPIGLPARARMIAAAQAEYRRGDRPSAGRPVFTRDSLRALRALCERGGGANTPADASLQRV
jgi:glycosyltransferase involved in cell wall biosynthesis